MRNASFAIVVVAASLTTVSVAAQDSPDTPAPRYMEAIDAELTALQIPHACEAEASTRAHCAWHARGRSSGREFALHLIYSDDTDTVYFYIDRYLIVLPDGEHTTRVLTRLMELNWQLLTGKLEWDADSGEVRLSMIQNTDSNFDRRAFRSLVREMAAVADRFYGELSRLAGDAPAPADPAEADE